MVSFNISENCTILIKMNLLNTKDIIIDVFNKCNISNSINIHLIYKFR